VEDATEGLGARYKGRMLGQRGDIACFSFNGNKLITTGGGGMIATNDERMATRARHLTTQAKKDAIEFIHDEIGYNYRLTNLQAAMGVAQLEQLDQYVNAKRGIAKRYQAALGDVPGLTPMPEAAWSQSTFWMYTIQIDGNKFGANSRSLLRHLDAQRIQTRPLWEPMHQSTPHRNSQMLRGAVAESLFRDGLCLPCSVGLAEQDQDRVIQAIRSVAGGR
jgi:perosamine synthetase